MKNFGFRSALCCALLCLTAVPLAAWQDPVKPIESAGATKPEPKARDEDQAGIAIADSKKLRIRVKFMAGYTFDGAQASLGFEKQGRVGYATVGLSGQLNDHFRYLIEINPINETQPGVACGEDDYFFPNAVQPIGPKVVCDNNGRNRVDDYRFVALDSLMQQGPIRQAYGRYTTGPFALTFGRFILPIGFGSEEVGSMSAKDATHIQRINTEASFGVMASLTRQARGRRLAAVSLATIIGDGNKYRDYDYFYGIEGSMDSNSWPAMVASGVVEPIAGLELRAAFKKGHTGSKVERFPNFFASKRNDDALVVSARVRPIRHVTVFGETARYTWGPMSSSATMLGLDPKPVFKTGGYIGGDFNYPVTKAIRVGSTLTREDLSRDDALIKLFHEQNQHQVRRGRRERSTVMRFYAEFSGGIRVGAFRNSLSNPYPWLSGITPVSGPRAFTKGRGSDKWGMIVNFILQ
jgi:hypothetical protein